MCPEDTDQHHLHPFCPPRIARTEYTEEPWRQRRDERKGGERDEAERLPILDDVGADARRIAGHGGIPYKVGGGHGTGHDLGGERNQPGHAVDGQVIWRLHPQPTQHVDVNREQRLAEHRPHGRVQPVGPEPFHAALDLAPGHAVRAESDHEGHGRHDGTQDHRECVALDAESTGSEVRARHKQHCECQINLGTHPVQVQRPGQPLGVFENERRGDDPRQHPQHRGAVREVMADPGGEEGNEEGQGHRTEQSPAHGVPVQGKLGRLRGSERAVSDEGLVGTEPHERHRGSGQPHGVCVQTVVSLGHHPGHGHHSGETEHLDCAVGCQHPVALPLEELVQKTTR